MAPSHPDPLGRFLSAAFRSRFSKIREIHRKYREPRIRTSGTVAFALLLLRLYLLFLVGVLFYKFYTLVA